MSVEIESVTKKSSKKLKSKVNGKLNKAKNGTNQVEHQGARKGKKPSADNNEAASPEKKKRPFSTERDSEAPPAKKIKTGRFKFDKKKGFDKKAGSAPSEKPDWNKLKEEKKDLRLKRRSAAAGADVFKLCVEAKKLMEPLRNRKCSRDQQKEQIPKVHAILKGHLLAVVFSHDMSLVVSMILKWAHTLHLEKVLKEVAAELMPEIIKMSQCNYASFVVRALIDYCQPQERVKMAKQFSGHVVKLLAHKLASGLLDRLYNELKSSEEQSELRKELYGQSYRLIPTKSVTGLNVIFESVPSMKESTLTTTKGNLLKLFEKGLMQSRLAHAVLLDYLQYAKPACCEEMLVQVRGCIKDLLGSKEGVQVVMKCLWMSSTKDRKKILKELKTDVVTLACKEHAHQLLLTIFDTVDDTTLVQKAILDGLLQGDQLAPLLSNTFGRKVLVYLCSRRDPHMFTEAVISKLNPGDINTQSKKDPEVRASELRNYAVPSLLKHFVQNSALWMEDNRNLLVLLSVIQAGSGDELTAALEAIAKYVTHPPNSKQEGIDLRIAENAGCHMVLKKIAEHDKVLSEKSNATFGEALVDQLSEKHYPVWLQNNRCCFLLLTVLKNATQEVKEELQSKIKQFSYKIWRNSNKVPAGGAELKKLL